MARYALMWSGGNVEPLWAEDPARLVAEFVESGGRALITCRQVSTLPASRLGRLLDLLPA